MNVFYDLACTVMVILDTIELGSQFECLPDGSPLPRVPRGDPPSFSSDRRNPPAAPHLLTSSSSHAGAPQRPNSRSPPALSKTSFTRKSRSKVLGYGVEQLEFIRLIPYKNPQRQFSLRKYTFPVDERIESLEGPNQYVSIPTQEQIVLSTLAGYVFAMLDGTDSLAGIYTYNLGVYSRVRIKINMVNGRVIRMTPDEIRDTPVGRHRRILYGYRVEHSNHNHESLDSVESAHSSRSRSSPCHIDQPTWLISSNGSGYALDDLQFFRLIPKKNPDQIFGLKRYTFPADKSILFLEARNHFGPIPIQQLIVLTTNSGDVFAILESSNALAGIYTYNNRTGNNERVKINIQTRITTRLLKQEIGEVPVGRHRTIINNFKIQHVDHKSSRSLMD